MIKLNVLSAILLISFSSVNAMHVRFFPAVKKIGVALAGLSTTGAVMSHLKTMQANKHKNENAIVFDREKMNEDWRLETVQKHLEIFNKSYTYDEWRCDRSNPGDWKVEGYWGIDKEGNWVRFWEKGNWSVDDLSKCPERDAYQGKYPFPKSHSEPFSGQDEFVKKLRKIEKSAIESYENPSRFEETKLTVAVFGGSSPSRFETGVYVGNGEFEDHSQKIRWPSGYRPYYIKKFNVRPSREFYEYVMNKNVNRSPFYEYIMNEKDEISTLD